MIIRRRLLAITITVLCTVLTAAIVRADMTVDGILDEPEWAQAKVFKEFVTIQPLSGESAKYATEVRLFTNKQGIYAGFTNYQPSSVAKIDRRFARDARIEADRNVFGIDFDGTGLSAYLFTVGSGNSKRDGVRNTNDFSSSWDGDWYSGTSSEDEQW